MSTARTCCRDGIFCTLCCFTHGVPEIGKLPFARCRHCAEGIGCAAHCLPPDACFGFRCAYLRGLSDDDTWPHRCGFVQDHRWTHYGRTWIMSAIKAAALDSSLARREIIRALERGMVVVIERPGRTDITFADDRPALATISRNQPQRISARRASEFLGFPVSAKPYVHTDLGARAWHQM